MSAASQTLAAHALATNWTALSAATQTAALTFLHDTLAVGIAGRNSLYADAIFTAAKGWSGSGGTSLILGRPHERLTAPHAAFVNGYQIHSQEFDCVHEPAVAHPMASIGAVLLADAGRAPASGSDFLSAIVGGVDVMATLGVAARGSLKFFRPATAGIFGAIAALCRLRRLSVDTATDAFGYGLAFASGTMQAHVEGKPTLAVQVAAAARSAIEAVDLAVAGLPGPVQSIDGPFGYCALFENDVDLAPLLAELGSIRRIEELSWKPFPTGRAAHGAIIALQELIAGHAISPDTLTRFTYRAPPLIHRLVGRRPFVGMSVAYARLCFAWLGAVVLTQGKIDLSDFTPERLSDPHLLALAERIHVEVDENPDLAAFVPAIGTATLTNGQIVTHAVARQFGSPEWPLSREQHVQKSLQCLTFGGAAQVSDRLTHLIGRLDGVDDVAAALADVLEN